ncbi:uncharacterized protein [Parasteatoda tepidariorum]|uniref:uncharacterized protein n=1 Tax=Parasteatoda tepidariorum TaxID=114398 RepID=UPI0039BCD278
MKFLIFILISSLLFARMLINADICSENKDCHKDECCRTAIEIREFHTIRTCKELAAAGDICTTELIAELYSTNKYCSCREGLKCEPSPSNSFLERRGICRPSEEK